MKRLILYVLRILLILLFVLFVYILITNLSLRCALKDLRNKNEAELKSRIEQERKLVRQDLDDKYGAKLISFEDTAKSLEAEKNKTKQLEQKLGETKEKNQKIRKKQENTTHP